ncbi:Uncharacterised protein [Mycobacteroides abscessus subsp. abscessus]|nr:Uncharacterised protein [Mycobacteroides abscessus subsp. abscessus]
MRSSGSLTASLKTPAKASPTPGSAIFPAIQRIAPVMISARSAPSSGTGPKASSRQSMISAPLDGQRR